jgi:hypothetical protein
LSKEWYLLKKKGEVGCFGRASPAQNTPRPDLLRRYKEWNETLRAQTDAIGKRFYSDEDLIIAPRVSDVAEARGLPMAQMALAWLLTKPVVTAPIVGATKPQFRSAQILRARRHVPVADAAPAAGGHEPVAR